MSVQSCSFALSILIFFFSNQFFGTCSLASVSAQCVEEHKELLLELKNNLQFLNRSLATKVPHWNESTRDCCQWAGVQCDSSGYVTGLDLSFEYIVHGVDSLWRFESLQSLNLSYNHIEFLPSSFGMLTNLRYLDLRYSGFKGQVPVEFSRLTRLVVLDLSSFNLHLKNPDLETLIQNFTRLRELYLDSTNISANGYHLSYLPDLRVLKLRKAHFTGPFVSFLAKIQSLEIIVLDGTTISSPFPKFLADFSHLKVLSVSGCNLSGMVPRELFQIACLLTIDLSDNPLLRGSLPEFPINSSLENLVLGSTNFSGNLPESIANLKMLSQIDLQSCKFSGIIPNSFTKLTELKYMDLSNNSFSGRVPSFNSLTKLEKISLSHNGLTGYIPGSIWEGLKELEYLTLSYNFLEGEIPASLFTLPSLLSMDLTNNRFSCSIIDFGNISSSQLGVVDLSSNYLKSIPEFLFELVNLTYLLLGQNKFHGSLDLTKFQKLTKISILDLSHNNFSEHVTENVSLSLLFPELNYLRLAGCNLRKLPNMGNLSSVYVLDLSDNNIHGEIPSWIWNINIISLNLSLNHFTKFQEPHDISSSRMYYLDLHSNMLGGQVPLPPHTAKLVDFSSNNFSSHLPNISSSLRNVEFFSVANNNIEGMFSDWWCNSSYIRLLDMSNNSLHGRIPSCLLPETLHVLNLRRNNLSGEIPDTFPLGNCNLQSLDLSTNHFQGKIPTSLSRCSNIEVLNLGDNNLTDMLPCFHNFSRLRVLALRSNSFYGNISCLALNIMRPNLQILDLSSNKFGGVLPEELFSNLKAMAINKNGTQPEFSPLHFDDSAEKGLHTQPEFAHWHLDASVEKGIHTQPEIAHVRLDDSAEQGIHYQDSVTVTIKGSEMELVKIFTIFTTVDFSNNNFRGVIPETVGGLDFLLGLNFSHNYLSGHIPASLGMMQALESLDLSSNDLHGEIPEQLANLTFLSVLNLSYNHLAGRIPHGAQMLTFKETSYLGNEGLCGFPLNRTCEGVSAPVSPQAESEGKGDKSLVLSEIFISSELGFFVSWGVIFMPLLFSKRWRTFYNKQLDKIILFILRGKGHRMRN